MKKYLQKLPFWPSGGKPGPAAAVPEQRPNDSSEPTPGAQNEEEAAAVRREDVDEHFRTVDEQDDSSRADSDV
jgi:hypothetical protein